MQRFIVRRKYSFRYGIASNLVRYVSSPKTAMGGTEGEHPDINKAFIFDFNHEYPACVYSSPFSVLEQGNKTIMSGDAPVGHFVYEQELLEVNEGVEVLIKNPICPICEKGDELRYDGWRNICSRCEIDL